jgi:hypothetical protein
MSRTKRKEERWPVDLDETMRQIIAPWELPTLCDPRRRQAQVTYLSKQTRGHLGGGRPSIHVTKKGLTQTTRIGPDLVPLMHNGRQSGQTTDQDIHLFPWKQVLERCAAMDEAAVEALRECNERNLKHMASYKPFFASKEAQGCGMGFRGKPEDEWTPAQKLYVSEQEKWQTEVDEPHREKSRILRAEQRRLFEACFTTNWFDSVEDEDLVLELDFS